MLLWVAAYGKSNGGVDEEGKVTDVSRDEVVAAAKAANAHDFIMGFKDGYDTLVGGYMYAGGGDSIEVLMCVCVDAHICVWLLVQWIGIRWARREHSYPADSVSASRSHAPSSATRPFSWQMRPHRPWTRSRSEWCRRRWTSCWARDRNGHRL